MNIELTNRIIKKMATYKKNVTESASVAQLEKYVDGARIQNGLGLDIWKARELFKHYAVNELGIDSFSFDRCIPKIEIVQAIDLLQNPYLKNITLPPFDADELKLETAFYQENEFAILNEPIQKEDLTKIFSVGIFDNSAYTYVLKNNNFVWMSICPMEINTMKKHIDSAYGNVLVLGGGLAYYPYIISLKNTVESIQIVESNETIYNYIKEYILPQFPNKKVNIVLSKAEEYIDEINLDRYDTVFFDIWEDNLSGAEYIKDFAKYELKYPNVKFQYWLYDSILDTFVVNISEYFNAKLGTDDYQDFFKRVAPDLWDFMESIPDTISRPEQIDYYLTRSFAKKYILGINKT